MIYHYKDCHEMTDQELMAASFNVENILHKGLALRNDPRYLKKFKNQHPPNINPALLEIRQKIAAEIQKREKEKQNA